MLQSFFHIAYGRATDFVRAIPYRYALIGAAGLLLFGLLVQLLLVWIRSDNVGLYRTIRRFVIKRGKIRKENAAVFCRKTGIYFTRKERKDMRAFFESDTNYRSSQLSVQVREKLYAPQSKPRFLTGYGLLVIGLLIGVLLVKDTSWLSVYAAAAGGLAVLGICNLLASAASRIQIWRNAKAAVKADALLCNYVCTGSDANPARIDLRKLDCKAQWSQDGVYRLGDSVGEFLEGCPDKGIARLIADGIERAAADDGLNEHEREYLKDVIGKIKAYCA